MCKSSTIRNNWCLLIETCLLKNTHKLFNMPVKMKRETLNLRYIRLVYTLVQPQDTEKQQTDLYVSNICVSIAIQSPFGFYQLRL